MLTSGTLHGLQELIASILAKDRPKNGTYFTPRVPKMAVYGSFISAPLGHVLITLLQKAFAGRTSTKAKVLQILVSNFIVCLFPSLSEPCLLIVRIGLSYSKHSLSCLHGFHCRCPYPPPSARNCHCRPHANNEGFMVHFPSCALVCAEVSSTACLGPILQLD